METTTQCIQLTPLAPHSLSFRPLVVPDNAVFKVEKFMDNRSPAWVSLDGANRFVLQDGESIIIEGSQHPLLFVTLKTDNLTDLWSQRLVKYFGWNTREQNKVLVKKSQRFKIFGGDIPQDEESKDNKQAEKKESKHEEKSTFEVAEE